MSSTTATITGGQRKPTYASVEQRGLRFRLGAIWRHRDLIWEITARNLKIRYRRSIFGFFWSVLNPLLNAFVFALVFQVILHSNIDRFILFIVIALVAWNAFTASVMESMSIITGSDNLIKRVNFPHEVLPIAVVLTNMVNFLLAMPSIFVVMILTHTPLKSQVIFFPVVLLSAFCFALGIAFISATSNVFFRDTRNFLDVVISLWFFLTPIIYPMQQVFPSTARIVYMLNPMASVIQQYRLIFYDHAPLDLGFLARTFVSCVITMVLGWLFFARLSTRFVEEL
ncbi:MAG: ABC transporter permease [Thermomicrobiales bacterium]